MQLILTFCLVFRLMPYLLSIGFIAKLKKKRGIFIWLSVTNAIPGGVIMEWSQWGGISESYPIETAQTVYTSS